MLAIPENSSLDRKLVPRQKTAWRCKNENSHLTLNMILDYWDYSSTAFILNQSLLIGSAWVYLNQSSCKEGNLRFWCSSRARLIFSSLVVIIISHRLFSSSRYYRLYPLSQSPNWAEFGGIIVNYRYLLIIIACSPSLWCNTIFFGVLSIYYDATHCTCIFMTYRARVWWCIC